MDASGWSTPLLAEFVAAISTADTEATAAREAVEHAAEALDADAAAIACCGELVAAVGFPEGRAPVHQLERVRPGIAGSRVDIPGVGDCAASAATLEHPPGATLVVARPNALTRDETGLLRGMAQVAATTMRLLHVLDDERAAREELRLLAQEQAALRRVATLVAKAGSSDEVFSAVAEEVAQLATADIGTVLRYDADRSATVVGGWGDFEVHLPIGRRLAVAGDGVAVQVLQTGRPARSIRIAGPPGSVADAFHRAGAQVGSGSPILVEGRLWGVVIAAQMRPDSLSPEAERRIAAFTELAATAIANAQARDELRAVAAEQAALRRVATLVARSRPPAAVFAAVAEEVGRIVRTADVALVGRYDSGSAIEFVGGWTRDGDPSFVGSRLSLGGNNVATLVFERNEPVRVDHLGDDVHPVTALARVWTRSSAGAPINVEGRLWGVMTAGAGHPDGLPAGIEHRLADFTELVATAIANAQAQAELSASRARIVTTADETRRKIVRDLHDGAQQRLVSLALQLQAAQAAVPKQLEELQAELKDVATGLTTALDELREYARGIHPSILTEGGLGPALKALADRSSLPVELDVRTRRRLPESVEIAAYYVVSEALTNAAKHANASSVAVAVEEIGPVLQFSVRDDGVGGASFGEGSGLVGIKDRIEALGGRMFVESPPGGGTSLAVKLPLTDHGGRSD